MSFANEQFRLEMINYLNQRWSDNITVGSVAAEFGYVEKYFNAKFKECFGIPFLRYLTKLRLHRAAIMISENYSLTNVGQTTGFGSAQSFSKAFKREFGLSPKEFLKSDMEVPDIPLSCQIGGEEVSICYEDVERKVIHGQLFPVIHGNQTNLLEEVGYYYEHEYREDSAWADEKELIELWWHDEQCEISNIIGVECPQEQDAPKDRIKVVMPPAYYAVATVRCCKNGGGLPK